MPSWNRQSFSFPHHRYINFDFLNTCELHVGTMGNVAYCAWCLLNDKGQMRGGVGVIDIYLQGQIELKIQYLTHPVACPCDHSLPLDVRISKFGPRNILEPHINFVLDWPRPSILLSIFKPIFISKWYKILLALFLHISLKIIAGFRVVPRIYWFCGVTWIRRFVNSFLLSKTSR